MKKQLIILLLLTCFACNKESLFDDAAELNLWLFHEGAEMPVTIEGNTNSKVFFILLHGGPGSTAQTFNSFFTPFSDPLEEDYAVVYWDQRNSGLSRGNWDASKITLEQHIEDLDQVIEFLKFKFGADISIFLGGQSWGGYLSEIYLLDPIRQAKIKAWVNIDGLCLRNRNIKDALIKIKEICEEQINADPSIQEWNTLLVDAQAEIDRNVTTYDKITENAVFNMIRRAERLLITNDLLVYNQGSSYEATYRNNVHPFILSANKRTLDLLIPQMYAFDQRIEDQLENIELPSLFLYGHFDVRTPSFQADYLIENIGTATEDISLVILPKSDHSAIGNEPILIATEIKNWIEKYK